MISQGCLCLIEEFEANPQMSIMDGLALAAELARHDDIIVGHIFKDGIDPTLAQWLNIDPSLKIIQSPDTWTIIPRHLKTVYELRDVSSFSKLLYRELVHKFAGKLALGYLSYGDPFLVGGTVYLAGRNDGAHRMGTLLGTSRKGVLTISCDRSQRQFRRDATVCRYNMNRVFNLTGLV